MCNKHLLTVIVTVLGCVLAGCHSNIKLAEVDPSAEVQLGLSVPVGTINVGINSFLGNVENLSLQNGVFTWSSTMEMTRSFHDLKLETYVPNVHINLNVYEQIEEKWGNLPIWNDGQITTVGSPIVMDLHFPLTVSLDGLNGAANVYNARLDSALIDLASFTSNISVLNDLPIQWDWIDSVTLDLGPQTSRKNGTVLMIYEKDNPKFAQYTDFGQDMLIDIDTFSLVLMKNKHIRDWKDYSKDNVVDTLGFDIQFSFTIPPYSTLNFKKNAAFDYNLKINFLNYSAVWGMFQPSKDMSAENVVDLSKSWGALDFLANSSFPFADPKIHVDITTQIAGAMRIDSAYIFSEGKDPDSRVFAQFGPNYEQIVTRDLENYLPIKSNIGDSATMTLDFDNTAEGGRIARLFKGIPKKLGYCFNVMFYEQKTPQIRITPNTDIHLKATASMPMKFNEGLHVSYTDTIDDINISQFSIDSLLSGVAVVDSLASTDIKIYMDAANEIPMDISASLRCYNDKDEVIMDPIDNTQPFQLFPDSIFKLKAPDYVKEGNEWKVSAPGRTTIVASLNKPRLQVFPKVKYMILHAELTDESSKDYYKDSDFHIQLTKDAKLALKIGLTAEMDAILNLGKNENKSNQ